MFEATARYSPQASAQAPAQRLEVARLPECFPRLYRAAYALCGSREDAEDLVQETFARVLRRPRLLRRDDDMAYLLRALRNTWISCHRAASVRPVSDGAADIELFGDRRANAAELAVEVKAVYEAIKTLPDPLRETIAAVDIAGLSYTEAARALGTRPGTIMSRLYRARERVADQIQAGTTG
jgi:RNA polymerase sigma-70 factor, ECF subfamily